MILESPVNMKQTTRLHGIFRSVIDWTIAPCEATPIASQDLLITGWEKSMRVNMKQTTRLPVRKRTCLRATHRQAQTGLQGDGMGVAINSLNTQRACLCVNARRQACMEFSAL
jgi:hypothetical protein